MRNLGGSSRASANSTLTAMGEAFERAIVRGGRGGDPEGRPRTLLSAADLQLRSVTEAQLRHRIRDYATLKHWLYHHQRPGVRRREEERGSWMADQIEGHRGLPDLILVRLPLVIFAELKRQVRSEPSVWQLRWLGALGWPGEEEQWDAARATLAAAPVSGTVIALPFLWRPSDWPEIERLLA
jgi:hypothetical protein